VFAVGQLEVQREGDKREVFRGRKEEGMQEKGGKWGRNNVAD
jgi:hypothetical protein